MVCQVGRELLALPSMYDLTLRSGCFIVSLSPGSQEFSLKWTGTNEKEIHVLLRA